MSDNLKHKTAGGIYWGAVSNGAVQVLNLAFGIILARLLTKEDYALVGMLTIFTALAGSIQEGGFIAALTNKREVSRADYSALFWFSFGISIILYSILFFCAPLIAAYYRAPELVALSRFVFLGFVISSLSCVPAAYMFRELKVKQRSVSMLIALVASGTTGVILALNGYAYWGLATQSIVYISVTCLLYWAFAARASSGRILPRLHPDIRPLRGLYAFASKMMLTNMANAVNQNLLTACIGRLYAQGEVGLYTNAYKWSSMGSSLLTGILQGVAHPTLAQVQADEERRMRVFRKMLRFAAFVSFPAMGGLALVAPELIPLAVTDKWLGSVPMMQVICIGAAFSPIMSLFAGVANSAGRSGTYLKVTLGVIIAQLLAVVICREMGIMTMIIVCTAVYALWGIVWVYAVKVSLLNTLQDIAPYIIVTSIALAAAYYTAAYMAHSSLILTLCVKIVVAAAVYMLILWRLNSVVLKESLSYIFHKNKATSS